jgi:hypothetical protein
MSAWTVIGIFNASLGCSLEQRRASADPGSASTATLCETRSTLTATASGTRPALTKALGAWFAELETAWAVNHPKADGAVDGPATMSCRPLLDCGALVTIQCNLFGGTEAEYGVASWWDCGDDVARLTLRALCDGDSGCEERALATLAPHFDAPLDGHVDIGVQRQGAIFAATSLEAPLGKRVFSLTAAELTEAFGSAASFRAVRDATVQRGCAWVPAEK